MRSAPGVNRWLLLCALGLLGGCERGMRDMYDQPRPHPDEGSDRSSEGRNPSTPPPNSVPSATGVRAAAGRVDRFTADDAGSATSEDAIQRELEHGQQRYTIYCVMCHGRTGAGDGIVVQRGFPRPPDLADAPLRLAHDTALDRAIDAGAGRMAGFGTRIGAGDRRAIVAYLRVLQLSRHASVDDVPQAQRDLLERSR